MAEAQVAPTSFNPAELIKRVEDTEKRLQTKDAEIQVYKMLMSQMEEELAQAKKYKAMQEKQSQDVDAVKVESEKTLTKAKSLIFERTKIIKNQELQIEAFVQQIESLKEVVRITKDLLEIRNLEIKQLEIKISAIEGKMKGEQERYDLMHKKLEQMIRHNGELKREYETQLCLFSALRERYNERELAKDVVDELKGVIKEEKINADQEKENNNNKGDNETTEITIKKEEQSTDKPTEKDEGIDNVSEKTEIEELQFHTDSNNALNDAKNRFDNVLAVLENTLNSKDTTTISEHALVDSNKALEDTSINNPPIEEVIIKEEAQIQLENSKVENKKEKQPKENYENADATVKSENIISENGNSAEEESMLGNIISVLKNTIGLGSDSTPVQTEENKVSENSTS